MPVTTFAKKKKSPADPVLAREQQELLNQAIRAPGMGMWKFLATSSVWILIKKAQTPEEQAYLDMMYGHWNKRLVPFRMNQMQCQLYTDQDTNNIILKYRQGGTTTYMIIVRLWLPSVLESGTSSLLISQTRAYGAAHFYILRRAHRHFLEKDPFDPSKNIVAQTYHEHLLHTEHSNRHEIIYDMLDSRIIVDTAENEEVGQGLPGITHLGCTEVARWPHEPRETMANVTESVSPLGTKDWESTANGMGGLFFEEYQKARRGESIYQAHFYEWPFAQEYRITDKAERKEVARKWYKQATQADLEEEKVIRERFFLDLEQLAWRRGKKISLGREFYEKYPEDDGSCVYGGCVVKLAGGKSVPISTLVSQKYSGKVLTVGGDGRLSQARVVGWYRTPRRDRKLYRLSYEHSPLDSFGKHRGVVLTEEHKVLTKTGWRRTDKCDSTLVATGTPSPGVRAFQVLLGTVLGDSSVSPAGSLSCSQIAGQYVRLKASVLRGLEVHLGKPSPARRFLWTSGKEYRRTKTYHLHSGSLPYFRWLRSKFYSSDGCKRVPRDLVSQINDFGIAVWFMDDGCLNKAKMKQSAGSRPDAEIALGLLPKEDGDWLAELLTQRGYQCSCKTCSCHPMSHRFLKFTCDGTERLIKAIARYIPGVMRYKVMADSRPFEKHWFADEKPDIFFDKASVEEVEPPRQKKGKYEKGPLYCLDVERTHNFVTLGGVVHNCFLSSGNPFFDVMVCRNRKLQCMTTVPLDANAEKGYIQFHRPIPGRNYILHGDVAKGERITRPDPDFSNFVVIDEETGQQMARYNNRIAPEDYAYDMVNIAELYFGAMISVENNPGGSGETVLSTLSSQLGYGNLFKFKMFSVTEKKPVEVLGLPTSTRTRPFMLNNLAKVIRENPELLLDELLWDQCLTFVTDVKGKPAAQEGAYDDAVLAMAGAQFVRLIRLGWTDPLLLKTQKYGKQQEEG